MSVLIKNMSMPEGCINCKLNNDSICVLINGCIYDETNGRTRRPDCPLVPVPPHGRLIDIDQALDGLAYRLGIRSLDYLTAQEKAVVSWFRTAPTIIEKEE